MSTLIRARISLDDIYKIQLSLSLVCGLNVNLTNIIKVKHGFQIKSNDQPLFCFIKIANVNIIFPY